MPRRRKRPRGERRAIPEHLVYAVCERFLGLVDGESGTPENGSIEEKGRGDKKRGKRRKKDKKWSANDLAKWLESQGYPTNREEIFPLIRRAIDLGFIRLVPPSDYHLEKQLLREFPSMPGDIHVLNVRPPLVGDSLAARAADIVLEGIQRVAAWKRDSPKRRTEEPSRVHIGFGAGDTTRMVAEQLARRFAMEASLPPLTLHAISSGFTINHPLSAPVAFFSYFTGLNHEIEYVGLFCHPVVKWGDYKKVTELPVIAESFREAKKIDIVVTSLAQADDEHGLLNMFLALNGGRQSGLVKAGQVGDIHWQPYSEKGPLEVNTGIRAVTLFDLPGLVRLAGTPGKHVVLVAGPCTRCGKSKSRAVRPLLMEPELRAFNHLVTDVTTARELLG